MRGGVATPTPTTHKVFITERGIKFGPLMKLPKKNLTTFEKIEPVNPDGSETVIEPTKYSISSSEGFLQPTQQVSYGGGNLPLPGTIFKLNCEKKSFNLNRSNLYTFKNDIDIYISGEKPQYGEVGERIYGEITKKYDELSFYDSNGNILSVNDILTGGPGKTYFIGLQKSQGQKAY
jgi:hypothetical protein